MGSKGERQDGLAGVGVNRVPPGFARSRDGIDTQLLAGLPAGSLRTLLTSGATNRARPRWAARLPDAGADHRAWMFPVSGMAVPHNGGSV
jgi:hypothetical protein